MREINIWTNINATYYVQIVSAVILGWIAFPGDFNGFSVLYSFQIFSRILKSLLYILFLCCIGILLIELKVMKRTTLDQ